MKLSILRFGIKREANNPRSPLGRMLRNHLASTSTEGSFEKAAMPGINLPGAGRGRRPSASVSMNAQSKERLITKGRHLSDKVKSMSDGEWEALPMKDKQAFTMFISQQLREAPTEVSEQQRRRYFETTMVDPSSLDFSEVKDNYQRLKLGLPVTIENPEQSLGVTQSMYEATEADLFNPRNAYKLENAMNHLKQLFVDYVRKKKEGLSTEAERRKLANMSADLNYLTQQHLASMFKYGERKVQEIIIKEKQQQLMHISAIREAVKAEKSPSGTDLIPRKEQIKRTLRDVYGVDTEVAGSILREMKAQEKFLQKCEVLARLTLGRGFQHTKQDENLDRYTNELKKMYSMDPAKLSSLDAVQFMAARDSLPPVDWAKRWYERALLVPLQATAEYQTIAKLQERNGNADSQTDAVADTETKDLTSASNDSLPPVPDVIDLVEKMFLPPDDERLRNLHEKRLRYVAYLHMDSQIKRMRANSRSFEGIEDLPQANEARALHGALLERKKELYALNGDTYNVFLDEQAADLFQKLMKIAEKIIESSQIESEAEKRAQRLRKVIAAVKSGKASKAAEEAHRTLTMKKQEMMERILGIIEKDTREDMLWVENMVESERPPLLPLPEPMSYVSAADVAQWKEIRGIQERDKFSPFNKGSKSTMPFKANLLGQQWSIPDKPMLFWGTGVTAVQQALTHAAEDAERRRKGEPLAPPYPCPENPWGWRIKEDILDL